MRRLNGVLIAFIILSSSFIIPIDAKQDKPPKPEKHNTIYSISVDNKYYLRGESAQVNVTGSTNQDFTLGLYDSSQVLIWSNNYQLDNEGFLTLNLPISQALDYGYYELTAFDLSSKASTMLTVLKVDGWSSVSYPLQKTHKGIIYTLFANATLIAAQGEAEIRLHLPVLNINWDSIDTYQNGMMFLAKFRKGTVSIDLSLALIHSGLKMIINGTNSNPSTFTFKIDPQKYIKIIDGFKSLKGNLVFNCGDLIKTKQNFHYNKSNGELKIFIPQSFSIDPEIFNDGFESGDYSAWTATNIDPGYALTVTSSPVHAGSWASNATDDAGFGIGYAHSSFSLTANPTEAWAQGWIRTSTFPQGSLEDIMVMGFQDSTSWQNPIATIGFSNASGSGNSRWALNYGTDGAVQFGAFAYGANETINENQWYCAEIHYKLATAPAANDGEAQLWIDQTLKINVTGIDSDTLTSSQFVFGLAKNIPRGTNHYVFVDDAIVNNASRVNSCTVPTWYLTSLFHTGISSISVNGTSTGNLTETAVNDTELALGVANAESGYSYLYWDNENVSHIHDITVTKTMTANSTITAFAIAVGGGGVSGVSMLLIAVVGGFAVIVAIAVLSSRKR